jgi:Ion transport protein
VKIISECIYDMKVFLFIFLTVLIAFNEAFTRLAEASDGDARQFNGKNWAQGYAFTFALAVGDTRADLYDDSIAPAIVWLIFCIVLLIMNVVMLNLMVAIVSKSFENINDAWESAMYQERASIIAENGYLIPWYRKQEHCRDKDQYLVITRDLLSEENEAGGAVEQVQNKINDLEQSLNDFKKEYRETQEEFSEKVTAQLNDIFSSIKKA